MLHWPSLYYLDISKFLDHINTPKDLLHRLDCEYKEGKGYRYFSSSFAKFMFYTMLSTYLVSPFIKFVGTVSAWYYRTRSFVFFIFFFVVDVSMAKYFNQCLLSIY